MDIKALTDGTTVVSVDEYKDEQTSKHLEVSAWTAGPTMRSGSERGVLEDMLNAISSSEIDDTPISVMVFELDNVLCTNVDKLKGRLVAFVNSMSQIQKELCFGGAERLQMLAAFLKEAYQANVSGADAVNMKCFVVADESSKMVVQLLKDTNLLKYFVSRNPATNKFLSHVIGHDHKIAKESANKKHLILLSILQFLQRSHDELLYIGHDKEVTAHLKQIKICKTYLCESKGLTKDSIQEIQDMHLS